MLTEEAHHMFVGQTGLGRVIERTCQVMKQHPDRDPREQGAIPLEVVQRYVNFWNSSSNDLFGSEISSNAASFFAAGLKGRANEEKLATDHRALDGTYRLSVVENGRLTTQEVPLRNAMNEVLRDEYVADNEKGIAYFNRICDKQGVAFRFQLPQRRFHRKIGIYADQRFDPQGDPIDEATWQACVGEWLPTAADKTFVKSLMTPVRELGKIASWIAPPAKGIDDKPWDWEYVRP
jgi:benzoyl-CoA 2,3-dioxygenase component B